MNKIVIPIALMAVSSIIIFQHDQDSNKAEPKQASVVKQQESLPPSTLPTVQAEIGQTLTMSNVSADVKQAPAIKAVPVSPIMTAPPIQPNQQTRTRHGHHEQLAHGHEVHTKPAVQNGKIPPTGANF